MYNNVRACLFVCVSVCFCLAVRKIANGTYVRERERDGGRGIGREAGRQTDRDGGREGDRQTDKLTDW